MAWPHALLIKPHSGARGRLHHAAAPICLAAFGARNRSTLTAQRVREDQRVRRRVRLRRARYEQCPRRAVWRMPYYAPLRCPQRNDTSSVACTVCVDAPAFPPASMAALCGAECVGAAGCARASARVWLGCNRCVAVQQCSLRPARRPPIPVRGRSRSGPSRCMQRSRSLGVSSS
jgi:hypothetical protein